MSRRKIYLVSPREPSGATWLINCLLELGIKTYRFSPAGMWHRSGDRWLLRSHEYLLRKWLPALVDHPHFVFRDDVEVQWMHEWFTDDYADHEVLYFVRDPRDALYSRYKREASLFSYSEFATFPDTYTLLDKITNWWLYNKTWLTHPRLHLFRFEDYKADAEGTLAAVLKALQLDYGGPDITNAVQCSTFDRAAAAERAYRAEHPDDSQLINRSGRPMEWQAGEMDKAVIARIEAGCGDLLAQLEYGCPGGAAPDIGFAQHVSRLEFFRSIRGLDGVVRGTSAVQPQHDVSIGVLDFLSRLSPMQLERARLPAHELQQLKTSLLEYLGSLGSQADSCIAMAMPAAAPPDRESMPMRRLPRGIWRRVRRILGAGA